MAAKHIFLTGGTGALAQEILPRILALHPHCEITLLVRARDHEDAVVRLGAVRGYVETFWPRLDLSRLTAIPGDVTLPDLGLNQETHARICRSVTDIIHAAASIKLNLSLDRAREINVQGTARMIALAERCCRLERMSYISTAYVAGNRRGRIHEEELACGQGFVNAYEQSKCEAELLMRMAMEYLPITIFRPSIIVGSSRDGHMATLAAIYGPIRLIASRRVRTIPGNGDVRLDLIPVDIVAEAIARLLEDRRSLNRTYHLTAGIENEVSVRWILDTATRILGNRREPELRFVELPESPAGLLTQQLQPFFDYLTHPKEFDDSNLREDLAGLASSRPHPYSYIEQLLAFCRRTGWGARSPWEDSPCMAALSI